MTIAVASDNGRTMSPHFGRSPYFLVFRVKDGVAGEPEIRTLQAALEKHDHEHGDGHKHGTHNHTEFIKLLEDCEAVISRGMGRRAALELEQYGIKPCVVAAEMDPSEAAAALATGTLETGTVFCSCHENK